MKVAVSLPDDVFEQAEELAHRLSRSRSRLYADALRDYLTRHNPDAVTEALNEVFDRVPTAAVPDPAVAAAARTTLARTEW